MNEEHLLTRIQTNPAIFGGKPIIRGIRFAVEHVLGLLAAGESKESILQQFPFLEPEDIQACILFAHRQMADERVYDRLATTSTP